MAGFPVGGRGVHWKASHAGTGRTGNRPHSRRAAPVSGTGQVTTQVMDYPLAGLNLTTVPKVLIETGNMRNATDAALLTSASGQRRIAQALEAAINRFLTGR